MKSAGSVIAGEKVRALTYSTRKKIVEIILENAKWNSIAYGFHLTPR